MPAITTGDLDRLIHAFEGSEGLCVIRASHAGSAGNPVILPRALYREALSLKADRGARMLIEASGLQILDIDIGEAATTDVDTQDDLQRLGGISYSSG